MGFQHLTVDTVRRVKDLALALRIARNNKDNGMPARLSESIMENLGSPPEAIALHEFIDSLPDDERAELLALMWLGRNDHQQTASDYPDLVADARDQLEHVGGYMDTIPLLEYLENGQRILGPATRGTLA
jgi:hypothetical protein